jgi:hypothetical protein
MDSSNDEYLTFNELRLLHRGSGRLQIQALLRMGITFQLDRYACSLVRYGDAKQYFLLLEKPQPRGLT